MNKSKKLTGSLLAGALLLVNGAPFVNPVQAKNAPIVSVENKNSNVSAQLVEQDGKNYLSVVALNDVSNVSVKVKVSNGQVITFKHTALKANETVMFELNIKDVQAIKAAKSKSSKKALPKTEVVRETLLFKGTVKGFELNAVVSYDVNKVEPVVKVESKEIKLDVITDKESKKSEVEKKDEVSFDELEKVADSEEKTNESKPEEETAAEPKPADNNPVVSETTAESTHKSSDTDSRMDVEIIVDTNNAKASEELKSLNTVDTSSGEVNTKVTEPKANVESTLQGSYDEVVAKEVFNQLNAHRVENGLQPLSVALELSSGTEVRAKEFAQKELLGKSGMDLHTRLDGSQWYTAFGGYGNAKAENVAYSVQGASGMMGFWKGSPTHNAAMLNPKFTKVLVKVFKHGSKYYGVQIFG